MTDELPDSLKDSAEINEERVERFNREMRGEPPEDQSPQVVEESMESSGTSQDTKKGPFSPTLPITERIQQDPPDNVHSRLTQAMKDQVWPKELSKTTTWGGDEDVDSDIQNWVDSVVQMEDPMWGDYNDIPQAAGLTVQKEIKESLTQPQGWSLDSIDRRLREQFPQLEPKDRRRIVRQETAAVLNRAQIVSLQARGDDPLVRWVGPDDYRTTDLCENLGDATADGVPFSEFMNMLADYAQSYPEGTPERVEQGLPHFQCRRTIEMVEE